MRDLRHDLRPPRPALLWTVRVTETAASHGLPGLRNASQLGTESGLSEDGRGQIVGKYALLLLEYQKELAAEEKKLAKSEGKEFHRQANLVARLRLQVDRLKGLAKNEGEEDGKRS